MLPLCSQIVAIVIVAGSAFQLLLSLGFTQLLRRQKKFELPIEQQHATAVLTCVRGCDPTLEHSIRGILDQDFDEYQVHVVVDHKTDDAWGLIESLKAQYDHQNRLRIHEMPAPRHDCGLKCQALVSGLAQVDPGTQFVVLMDADVRPHRTWLKEIAGPLVDPAIGVSTGNQWFEPNSPASLGGLTRSLWNAGALVPTTFFQNPWAGSLAMRMDDIRKTDLISIWKKSLVDDGPIRDAFQEIGLKIHFSPSIIMINRENSQLPFVRNWIARMLTWSRLYERTFFTTVIHAAISSAILFAAFFILALNIVTWNLPLVLLGIGSLLASGTCSVLAWMSVRAGANYSCGLRGEALPPLTWRRLLGVLLMISTAQFFYATGCLRAIFANQVRWREITYDIDSRTSFQMNAYQPITSGGNESRSKVSI